MRKLFYSVLIFFVCIGFTHAQQNKLNLKSEIDSLFNDDYFQSTLAAVDVYDLTKGEFLYQKNSKLLFHPASNLKILTSAAALLFLDTTFNFNTSVFHDGYISNDTLYGNLYTVGGFDPLLKTSDLNNFTNYFLSNNIKVIKGNLAADISQKDSLFWGSGWMWDDDPSSDAPYLSSININSNSVEVITEKNRNNLIKIKLIPNSSYFQIENNLTFYSDSESVVKVSRDWINRSNKIIVNGNVGYSFENDTSSVNVFNPPEYYLSIFNEKLDSAGIKLTGNDIIKTAPDTAKYLFSFITPIDSVINYMNKNSDNLSAEMLLYVLSKKYFKGTASAEKGIKLIDSLITLADLDPGNYRIVDGSGVSHYNLVSSELMLKILNHIYYSNPEIFLKLYNSFPIAGIDGTLEDRMQNTSAENNVHAKTGTLSGVSCLSGYSNAANGDLLSFSIFIQNFVGSASTARDYQDKICDYLSKY